MENICPYCNNSFSNKSNLSKHIKTSKQCLSSREIIIEKTFDCKFCEKIYVHKSGLSRHLKNCSKKIASEDVEKSKFIEMQNKLKQAEHEKEVLRRENIELIGKLNYEKGLAKGTKKTIINNNNLNTGNIQYKLEMIPTKNIGPLTIKSLKDKLPYYSIALYKIGSEGVVEFIKNLVTMKIDNSELCEHNYICTNPATKTFHRYGKKGWGKDINAEFIKRIFTELTPIADNYWDVLHDEVRQAPMHEKDFKFQIIDGLKPFHYGLAGRRGDAKHRAKLFNYVAKEISAFTSIHIAACDEEDDEILPKLLVGGDNDAKSCDKERSSELQIPPTGIENVDAFTAKTLKQFTKAFGPNLIDVNKIVKVNAVVEEVEEVEEIESSQEISIEDYSGDDYSDC